MTMAGSQMQLDSYRQLCESLLELQNTADTIFRVITHRVRSCPSVVPLGGILRLSLSHKCLIVRAGWLGASGAEEDFK